MSDLEARYEVLVVGAGNAGLAAAISAAENGAKVAMLEKAPKDLRGGNTFFTAGFRFYWDSLDNDILPLISTISEHEIKEMRELVKPYPQGEFYDDVMRVSEGRADPNLVATLVGESLSTMRWLRALGHEWIPMYNKPAYASVVSLNGGGASLSDRGFDIAAKKGVDIRYQNIAMELLRDSHGHVIGVYTLTPQGFTKIYATAVILASGGFEANTAMRAAYLGPGWDTVKVRGVPFNTGDGLRMAWDIGAQAYGNLCGCHATPADIDRPEYSVRNERGLGYERHFYSYGIMVNIDCQRFVDEGFDFRPYTYAKYGRAIMSQPHGIAFQIFDKKTMHLVQGGYTNATGSKADTLEDLARGLGLEPKPFIHTIQEYNRAVQPGDFNHRVLDGKDTKGLTINKSNWALPIDTPPFHGYGVCCSITFTYGGLHINTEAQVMSTWEAPIPGLYACGEIVGGLFFNNYPACAGMTQGTVFGRRAGLNAAKLAKGE